MSSLRTTLAAILALGAFAPVFAQNADTACYDNRGDASSMGINTYQSLSLCKGQCLDDNKAVWGVTKGSTCYCGNTVPSEGKVDMKECDVSCQGYPQEKCGGNLAWLFGYTGVVPPDDDTSSPKSSKTSSTAPSSTDVSLQTTVLSQDTATVTTTPDSGKASGGGGGGTSTAGIAAGAVVGVVAAIGLGVGVFLYMRRNRRRQAEEEYRAAVAAKEFTASIRKPQQDSRLDPVMLQHRLSDGSIADNQDFSRRILKVTNPDDA